MPGKITLTGIDGTKQSDTFFFSQYDTLLVGRMDGCQVCLPDDR
jgi:hypothetical protein